MPKPTIKELEERLETCNSIGNELREKINARKKEEREKARAKEDARIKEFRERLESEYYMEKHEKRDKIWAKAWEHGHSGGFNDIEFWYGEFADIAI